MNKLLCSTCVGATEHNLNGYKYCCSKCSEQNGIDLNEYYRSASKFNHQETHYKNNF